MSSFFTTPPLTGHKESYVPKLATSSQGMQLALGPLIMAIFLVLQSLYKNATGSHNSQLYTHVVQFVAKAEARDKVGRIAQYCCRCIQGILAHCSPEFPLQAYKPAVAEIQTTLAWARRTHRWGKELPHIPVLGEAVGKGDLLEVAQRAVLITFLVQDHMYWLLKVGLVKFSNYTAIEWHRRNLRFITLSHVLNFALCVRSINRIQAKQQLGDPKYSGSEESVQKARDEIYDNQRMIVRYVLTFIQMIHVSGVKQLDDWYIGIFGMISSYIDASKQW